MVEVSIEFLQSIYDQMELMWYQINAEWGPAGDRLEKAIADGREPVIAQLRELIFTGTSPQTDSRSPTISKHCNLDVDIGERARALHRVVRAMHDGHCPKCGCLESADQFMRSLCHVCPDCGFTISIDEAHLALAEFRPYLQRSVEVFEKWRDELNNKKGNKQ